MKDAVATRFRLLASVVSVLVLLLLIGVAWFYFHLRASLPQLEGTARVSGLSAAVTVARDASGVPTIAGANRADVARALGFVHAQDRFFQMDLLRRRAAGELAELFGAPALSIDRATKPHRFRALAGQVAGTLPASDRALLSSYREGVNAGLHALSALPFEYALLRVDPAEWQVEDSILIIYAMTLDLQDATNTHERSLTTLRDRLGLAAVNFFAPLLTPDDAALDGSHAPVPEIPAPEVIDVRGQGRAADFLPQNSALAEREDGLMRGSNSFALSGAHTANGAALLANDPHLQLGVPNLWYRALLKWNGAAGREHVVGGTIPGLPFVILGTNGHIAWGLTDAYADTNDLVAVEVNPVSASLYKVPGEDDFLEIETHRDQVDVKGAKPEVVETRWTRWGPIVATDFRGRPLAHRWVAYDAAATNVHFMHLESARSVAEAVEVAHRAGMPAHAFLVVDDAGALGWTTAGTLPKRVGFDGRLPATWSFGDRYWDGRVAPDDVPTLLNPASGRLWTANNRLVGGTALEVLGDGGYARPARARQIRDQLNTMERATEKDFLALQRDDRALFLERWQGLLLNVLSPTAVSAERSRGELRRLVSQWEGRASVESVSYRLVRSFRLAVVDRVLGPIFASCLETQPDFAWKTFNYEPAVWKILERRPKHLLSERFASWDALLLDAADSVTDTLADRGVDLKHATWGARNRADIAHPLGHVLPEVLTGWWNMARDPLPGDVDMPLVQSPSFGASMRLVVSPGHESEALFEMPGGQSGHPLSPFYRSDHAAWVSGTPAPLLPGPTRHTLQLIP